MLSDRRSIVDTSSTEGKLENSTGSPKFTASATFRIVLSMRMPASAENDVSVAPSQACSFWSVLTTAYPPRPSPKYSCGRVTPRSMYFGRPSLVATLAGAAMTPHPCVYRRCWETHVLFGRPAGFSSRAATSTCWTRPSIE